MKMEKQAVCYGEGIAPYCPRCGSGEYLHNEDGNENNFCGQCGCPLDWSQMYNEDTEQIEEKYGNTTEPNIFEICPKCGKFKYINCTCAHTNER